MFKLNNIEIPKNKSKDKDLIPKDILYLTEKDTSKDVLYEIALCIYKKTPCLIEGVKGIGKTTAVFYLAQETQNPLLYIQLTGETTPDELLGKWLINDKGTYWIDGIVTTAIKEGYWLVLDEVNVAMHETLACLQSILDGRKSLCLTDKNNEIISVHENFRLFATMNPTDEYVGTKELNSAFVDRFIKLKAGYPSKEKEIAILKSNEKVNINDKEQGEAGGVITRMVEFAEKIRSLHSKNKISFDISTRNLIDWAMLCDILSIKEAFRISVMNKIEIEQDKKELQNILNAIFSDKEFWGVKFKKSIYAKNKLDE